RERYRALEPGGFADVALDIELGPEGIELRRGELALAGGRATTPLSIGGIRGLRGRASVDERGEIQGSFAGEWGDGISRIDLAATLAPDRRSLASVEGEVKLDGLTIDGALASRCHPILARLIRELGLSGRARLEISLPRTGSFPPDLDAIVARAELESAELQPQWFPYVFRGDHLRATYEGGIVRIEPGFELRAGQGTISIGRAFFEPSSAGLVDVEIGVHDLAVDARLLRAAPESARAILESLDPSGRASATILVRRLRGGGDAERSDSQGELATGSRTDASASLPRILVEARVADGRVRYREFPYPVDSISGEVLFDSETGELGFRSFRGQHGATEIEFTGRAACYAHEMDLVFSSRNLAVDDGLLAALPASYRHLLTDFGFRGNVAAEARIARAGTDPETANTLGISASIIDATFEHRLFPYPVPLASGRVEISSGSEVRIADLRTPEDHDPHLEFDGVFRMESPKPTFDFRLALDGLAVDERLKRALPDALRRLSDAIRLEGT
ncbi:MAG TPA: hypothetical protein VK116_20360, partial [Planctomycetota bacterium]|nr:hypothetical protein [Planctomycetota bacterium]